MSEVMIDVMPPSPWQPIETAPRDGTIIDLYGITHIDRPEFSQPERWCNARWRPDYAEEKDGWRGPWSDGFDSRIPGIFTATHWMLPPTPPLRAAVQKSESQEPK